MRRKYPVPEKTTLFLAATDLLALTAAFYRTSRRRCLDYVNFLLRKGELILENCTTKSRNRTIFFFFLLIK